MIRIQLGNDSPYSVRLPRRHQRSDIIALAKTFVAYEQQMPPEQQTPYTESIQDLLAEILDDRSTISAGESRRLSASEAVKRDDQQARRLVSHMAQVVRAAVYDAPEEAYQWGFQVRQSSGTLRQPKSRRERLALLEAYIAKETSRPEADRFTAPALNDVRRISERLARNLAVRHSAQTQRESGIAARNSASHALIERLQAAAVYLVANRFGFNLSLELQHWGFDVIVKRHDVVSPTEMAEPTDQWPDLASAADDDRDLVDEYSQNGTYQPEPRIVNGVA